MLFYSLIISAFLEYLECLTIFNVKMNMVGFKSSILLFIMPSIFSLFLLFCHLLGLFNIFQFSEFYLHLSLGIIFFLMRSQPSFLLFVSVFLLILT